MYFYNVQLKPRQHIYLSESNCTHLWISGRHFKSFSKSNSNCKKWEYQLGIFARPKSNERQLALPIQKSGLWLRQTKGKCHGKPCARGRTEQDTPKIKLKPTSSERRDFVNIQNWCYSVCLESIAKRNWSLGRMTSNETYTRLESTRSSQC